MPQCAFHPDVETEVQCNTCGRYICPKDMVPTPVGYKCPICAKPERSQYTYVKPRQWVLGGALAIGAGIGGAIVLSFIHLGFFSLIIGYMWGVGTAEAARRGSGGHRGREMVIVSVTGILLGGLVSLWLLGGGVGLFTIVAAIVGAASTLAWSWNG